MNKKILALALAIVFIATAFTACKNGPELTEVNGMELPLATDKEGNTIINDSNQIAVLVTDENNEVLTYADGENQTHWAQLPGDLVKDDYIENSLYKLGVPSGWEGKENGRVIKKNTDDKCYIKFTQHKKLETEETLDSYLEAIDMQDTLIADTFADSEAMAELAASNPQYAQFAGCEYTLGKDTAVLTSKTLNCQIRTHKIVNAEGEVVHYVENYYFVAGGYIYSINYICEGGEGYEQSFNFRNYVSESFTFKGDK